MRVLIGHLIDIPEVRERRPLPGRERCQDEVIAFGNGYRHLSYEPGMTWNDLLAGCPGNWRPDVFVHVSPEYNPIPRGLQDADCLTVGVVGDWNLGSIAIAAVGDLFDALFADRNGGEMLRRKGYPCVRYAPHWAYDPARHHRLPDVIRDIDILMLGNFNHAIQWERAPWLARVARLSRHHEVLVTSGLFGDEYTRAMNRAKIVFNRSIRGELNMRAYEAPACGALMFYERENTEVHELFTDRVDCVLYGENDLEALLKYYLAPENAAERERIAAAGEQRVREHSYAHHFSLLLNEIDPLVAERRSQGTPKRGFCRSTPTRQAIRTATQWLYAANAPVYPQLDRMLSQLQAPSHVAGSSSNSKEQAEIANLRALAVGEWASRLDDSPERTVRFTTAIAQARRCLQEAPDNLLYRCNLGMLCMAAGQDTEGVMLLQEAYDRLNAPNLTAAQLQGAYFPRRFEFFDVQWEQIGNETEIGSDAWKDPIRALLQWRIEILAMQRDYTGARFPQALGCALAAAKHFPDSPVTQYHLAGAHRALGQVEPALTAYHRTLTLNPFHFEAREELARLYLDLSRPQEALTLLEDTLTILEGCPFYSPLRRYFEPLQAQAQQLSTQPQPPMPPLLRLLAFPNWRKKAHWQGLLRAFLAARSAQPTLLMLRADPQDNIPADSLLRAMQNYLVHELGFSVEALPPITLLNQPLPPDGRWKLLHIAEAVLDYGGLPAEIQDLVLATGLPVRTLTEPTTACVREAGAISPPLDPLASGGKQTPSPFAGRVNAHSADVASGASPASRREGRPLGRGGV